MSNPMRGKCRKIKNSKPLKKRWYVVAQFTGHMKVNVLEEFWVWSMGLLNKSSMIMTELICYGGEAMRAFCCWQKSLKMVRKHCV